MENNTTVEFQNNTISNIKGRVEGNYWNTSDLALACAFFILAGYCSRKRLAALGKEGA